MLKSKMVPFVAILCIIAALKTYALLQQKEYMNTTINIPNLFPTTPQELETRAQHAMTTAREAIAKICAVPASERTWENTALAYDRIRGYDFAKIANAVAVIFYTSPHDALRAKAQDLLVELEKFATDVFGQNVALYKAFKEYVNGNAKKEKLSAEQNYFLRELMNDFKRSGLDLPEEKQTRVRELIKELAQLAIEFEQNISKDQRFIIATREELDGLEDDFINGLTKTEDGLYKLGTDYPTYFQVMEFCNNADIRKRLYYEFNNRAYPANAQLLATIIAKRDELAKVLGFTSYAQLNLDDKMAKMPERARTFLDDVAAKVRAKEMQEFAQFTKELPTSVVLTSDKKLYPWDRAYLITQYKKRNFNLDEREIAQFFPMEKTVEGLLAIYKKFFGLTMQEMPVHNLWDNDLKLIKISNQHSDKEIGYIILDLYPRPHKFTHACEMTVIPSVKDNKSPAVVVVLANFPKSTAAKPSLLELNDVRTFFHEFGHAIHDLLGATMLATCAGTSVKRDFVELPSQILEEWLWSPEIIKMVSNHYKTGEKLSDDKINNIVAIKNLSSGFFTTRQLMLAYLSLDCYDCGSQKDADNLFRHNFERMRIHERFDSQDHMYCSFGHLMGYGAGYYGYLWSKVFALDIFETIKQKNGLLDSTIGQKYTAAILAPGGSQDPYEMLKEFLGREPNSQAFFNDLGCN